MVENKCDEFEDAWRNALARDEPGPDISEFLCDVDNETSSRLFRELLLLDFEYAGVRDPDDLNRYFEMFPQSKSTIRQAFDKHLNLQAEPLDDAIQEPFGQREMPSLEADRFEVMQFIARGGLGDVFIAKDQEIDREVAVKGLQVRHSQDETHRHQFVVEAGLTGQLEHPGIIPVYGFGRTTDGRPYYAMRYIDGDTLLDAIEKLHAELRRTQIPLTQSTTFRGLLRRFASVCRTIDYAHSRRVIHRDIKPANIMLGPFGESIVVDWGLAIVRGTAAQVHVTKASGNNALGTLETVELELELEQENPLSGAGEDRIVSENGLIVGTPAYMSPEQASGVLRGLTFATDTYGLGTTLYHLLTGRAPFGGHGVRETLSCVKAGNFTPPRQCKADIPENLEAVCLKSMALCPEDRYGSAGELAADIDRWLDDEPVTARKESILERSWRWARRNRTTVGVSFAALLMVAAVTTTATFVVNNWRSREETARILAEQNAERAKRASYASHLFSAGKLVDKDPGQALEILNNLDSCPEDLRCFCWSHYYRACRRDQITWATSDGGRQSLLAGYSKNGSLISADLQGSIKWWDVSDGRLIREISTGSTVTGTAMDLSRTTLATSHDDGTIGIWDAVSGKSTGKIVVESGVIKDLLFTKESDRLISLSVKDNSQIVIWNKSSGERFKSYAVESIGRVIDISPDGRRLAIGGAIRQKESLTLADIAIIGLDDDAEPNRLLLDLNKHHSDSVDNLKFVDDQTLLVCSAGILAKVTGGSDASEPLKLQTLTLAHNGTIHRLRMAGPNRQMLAVTAGVGKGGYVDFAQPNKPVAVWNTTDLTRETYLAGIVGEINDIAVDATGYVVATLSREGEITIHDLNVDWTKFQFGHAGPVEAIAFNASGTQLTSFAATEFGQLTHRDVATGEVLVTTTIENKNNAFWFPARTSSGGYLAQQTDGPMDVVDPRDGSALGSITLESGNQLVAVSPSRDRVAVFDSSGRMKVIAIPTQKVVSDVQTSCNAISTAAFNKAGDLLAWVDSQSRLFMLDATHGGETRADPFPTSRVEAMAFSNDGKVLAISTVSEFALSADVRGNMGSPNTPPPIKTRSGNRQRSDSQVILWDVESRTPRTMLRGHAGTVQAIAFSPNDRIVATGGLDWQVKLWETASGTDIASASHQGPVTAIAFSPDAQELATASRDGSVMLWLTAPESTVVDREAFRLVKLVQDAVPLKQDMLARVQQVTDVTNAVRIQAQKILEKKGEDLDWINRWSWDVVRVPGRSETQYQMALTATQKASAMDPQNPRYLNTLGAALYRTNQTSKAIEMMTESLDKHKSAGQSPADLAFLAMAHWQAGNEERARQLHQDFAKLMQAPAWQSRESDAELAAFYEELKVLFQEVTTLLGPVD
ncbi:WD40 repeat domain-containing serine/threonine-protein kinase [Rhodopirellula sallentina]|uniref:WD40 repeat domain-containing serine/threonine-protein kinase n=1 Tax=Rhodopirellula sallentina TaxID=1263869 RepID=UPI001360B5C9|nr:WD40 repeat domain-containing serine/threonine-protein kinase [Rhodopirellula sallentina]